LYQYAGNSRIKKIKVKRGRHKIEFFAEVLNSPLETLDMQTIKVATSEIRVLVKNNWGDFGQSFIRCHVLSSNYVVVLRNSKGELVGLASISKKNLSSRELYYFELTVVDKNYESLKLAYRLNYLLMNRIIVSDIFRGRFHWEFMLITPNMKVLGSLANIASFIYPDPYEYDPVKKRIPKADKETWAMTQALIKSSDHPERPLHREGNVLEDSYIDLPSLIYKPNEAPKYLDDIVNNFGEHYLGYSQRAGKELVVRVKFGIGSLLKSLLNLINT
jgi:hypothetical protein